MRRRAGVLPAALITTVLLGCGSPAESPRARRPDAVFDADVLWVDRRIGEGMLSSIDPELARRDLSLARAFVERRGAALPWARRTSLARGLLAQMQRKSVEVPPSEDELGLQKARLWLEVDRPPSRRALEVFLPVPRFTSDAEEAALAAKIAEATKDDEQPQTFAEHAQGVKEEGITVEISVLPPLTADHRVAPLDHQDDPKREVPVEVSDALFRLSGPGAKSGVIGSSKGFHLLFLIESYPEARVVEPELGERLRAAVLEARLAPELARLRGELRGKAKVSVPGGVDSALELAWAAP